MNLFYKTTVTVSRYTHIEAECPFITFEDLLNKLEDLVCDVVNRVLKSPAAQLLYDINPVRPFCSFIYMVLVLIIQVEVQLLPSQMHFLYFPLECSHTERENGTLMLLIY